MIKKTKLTNKVKKQKTILLRLDLNVPINRKTETILDTERIDVVIPEIKNLALKNKVIIFSHIGKGEKKDTINPVEEYLRSKFSKNINQNIKILENTRWLKGETAKEGSKEFMLAAKYFAEMGDEYIDDAFASMHRSHASITGVPKILKSEKKKVSFGDLVKFEKENLDKALNKIKKEKTLIILSGAKISTKLPLIIKFLNLNCKVFVCGGIANQIIKDILNYNIGLSFFETNFTLSQKDKEILKFGIEKGKLILPVDVLLKNNQEKNLKSIHTRDRVVDIGRESLMNLKIEIKNSKNIILNGPLGIYEEGFNVGTKEILEYISLTALKDKSIFVTIGGGDTLAIIKKIKIKNTKNIFISTGGGAMLEYFLYDGDLPGITALK